METLPGSGDPKVQMSWQRAISSSTVYRIDAKTGSVITTLQSAGLHTTIEAAAPAVTPVIQTSAPEPLSGTVTLSVGDAATYPAVDWFVDLAQQSAHANTITWNSDLATSGSHALLARIATSTDTFLEVGRTVTVAPHAVAVQGAATRAYGTTYYLDIYATSVNGIASVSATLDGQSLGTLTERNACTVGWICQPASVYNNAYRFILDGTVIGSGTHTAVVTATDSAGHMAQTTIQVIVSNAPVITLTSPADGSFANGALAISGTATSDKPGAVVSTTITLSDYQVLQTTSNSFSTSFNINGLAPGAYTLTVTSKDSNDLTTVVTRTISVASDASLVYTPVVTIGADGRLLAAEDTKLLYQLPDGSVRLRGLSGGEVVLAGTDQSSTSTNWQVSDGAVYAASKKADCPSYSCIYRWTSDGAVHKLSTGNSDDLYPVARDGYAVWASQSGLVLYKLADGSSVRISPPAGASAIGNNAFDFAVANGKVTVFFWAKADFTSSIYNIYKWSSDTGVTEKLTADTGVNIYPQTDGTTVAWTTSSNDSPVTVKAQPVSGGSITTVTTNATNGVYHFILKDGILVWTDASSPYAIKALYNGAVNTLTTTAQGGIMYGTSGGVVVFSDNGKIYSWNAATGQKKLRIDSSPNQVIVANGYMYFSNGGTRLVFRVPLN